MERIDTLIVGGGQAGLAMSHALSERGVEHVVLERGRVGERWRSERWESLRLLTPRWLSRVGGWQADGGDPNAFMHRDEVVRYLDAYARYASVPVVEGVDVISVERDSAGYRVRTSERSWHARHVVVATGESQQPFVPRAASDLTGRVRQVVPTRYRRPDDLPEGGVLVVGASATGIQLAQEIHATGRRVTLSVGRHTRLPRRYRGRDILAWFHDLGLLDQRPSDVASLGASRHQPSMQLIGSLDHRTLDLNVLQTEGVRLIGRLSGARDERVFFADDLVETMAAAEVKLARLLLQIDGYVARSGLADDVEPAEPFRPVSLPGAPGVLHLRDEGIRSVVWATGFRRDYPWLRVPVLNRSGEIRHRLGITPSPGLYVLGLNFLRRRSSSFLGGVAADAEELADDLLCFRVRSGRAA